MKKIQDKDNYHISVVPVLMAFYYFLWPVHIYNKYFFFALSVIYLVEFYQNRNYTLKLFCENIHLKMFLCIWVPIFLSFFVSISPQRTFIALVLVAFSFLSSVYLCRCVTNGADFSIFFRSAYWTINFWFTTVLMQMIYPEIFGHHTPQYCQGIFDLFGKSMRLGSSVILMTPMIFIFLYEEKKISQSILFCLIISFITFKGGSREVWVNWFIASVAMAVFFFNRTNYSVEKKLTLGLCALCLIALIGSLFIYFNPHSRIEQFYPLINEMSYKNFNTFTSGRLDMWGVAIKNFLAHPILGTGANSFILLSNLDFSKHPHQQIIDILSSSGLIGLFGILLFYYYVFQLTLKALSKQSAMAFAAAVSIWSMFFPFNVGNNFYSTPQVTILWVLVGFAVGLTHAKSDK